MNDTLFVCCFQRFSDLFRDQEGVSDWNPTLRSRIGKRRSLNERHHERRRAIGLFQSMNLRDIRMIETSEHFCLALEAGQALGVGRDCVWQELDRDATFQVEVSRPVNLSHSAFADE